MNRVGLLATMASTILYAPHPEHKPKVRARKQYYTVDSPEVKQRVKVQRDKQERN